MNAFNDTGLGEPEQDANTALIELDKGLFAPLIFLTYLQHNISNAKQILTNNLIINANICV